jgi:hypothetical protein
MTYREDIHPDYSYLRRDIAASPLTFVLLPSLDLETCVTEVVRRQINRPFSRSVKREEQVIRARFALYRDIPATKIETMRPVVEVVEAIVASMAAQQIIGREPRKRVSQGALVNQELALPRGRVNSAVRLLF